VNLQVDIAHRLFWQLDRAGSYSIRGVYYILTSPQTKRFTAVSDWVWHKDVSFKVSIFTLRLLRNRLCTKDNLVRRDVIPIMKHNRVTSK